MAAFQLPNFIRTALYSLNKKNHANFVELL